MARPVCTGAVWTAVRPTVSPFISLSTPSAENESALFTVTCSAALMWHFFTSALVWLRDYFPRVDLLAKKDKCAYAEVIRIRIIHAADYLWVVDGHVKQHASLIFSNTIVCCWQWTCYNGEMLIFGGSAGRHHLFLWICFLKSYFF